MALMQTIVHFTAPSWAPFWADSAARRLALHGPQLHWLPLKTFHPIPAWTSSDLFVDEKMAKIQK